LWVAKNQTNYIGRLFRIRKNAREGRKILMSFLIIIIKYQGTGTGIGERVFWGKKTILVAMGGNKKRSVLGGKKPGKSGLKV